MINYNEKPILIFYETTKACGLACRHCRASAMEFPLNDELSYGETINFVKSIKDFGKPYPVLILTGGDVMRKNGIKNIIKIANENNIPVSVSPAATTLLSKESLNFFKENNVLSISLSLDGNENNHDWLRGNGVYDKTINLIKEINNVKMKLQINTVVMKRNIMDLPDVLKLLIDNKINIWEVFFLIKTGRAIDAEDLTLYEHEDINHWLLFAMNYNIIIRTVESPILRRIIDQGNENYHSYLYDKLVDKTIGLLGKPENKRLYLKSAETRDGKGIIFVSHNGDVSPSGFLPVALDNVKNNNIVDIYRNNTILKKLRNPENFEGPCGSCNWNDKCGGSRSRAYSYYNNIFAKDPACINSV